MLTRTLIRAALPTALMVIGAGVISQAGAHGEMAPHAVDTGKLSKLGSEWRDSNPYANTEEQEEAVRVGSRAYNLNCARCHGLEVVSGGIAPDLRKLNLDCGEEGSRDADCMRDMDEFFITTVRKGRTRDGRVYMPPFDGILSQEAIWALRSYINSRPYED